MSKEINITGWDFSKLIESGRMKETKVPWNYHSIVKQYMQGVKRMLDMGTGGGEFLISLAPLPEDTFATEGYQPNVSIAEENLKPYGVKVISGYKDDKLPFENNYFELIINRHEFYEPREVYRILKPGCVFITQQVKGNCDDTIIELFNANPEADSKDWGLDKAVKELMANGFEIHDKQEANGFTEFTDTAALASYLKVINWLVPDFSVHKYSHEINELETIISKHGKFRSTLDRFLLITQKPL
ncbi:MAG: class I SAM-dependent methyltransferase [Ignavibacteria bacterium]